MAISRIEDMNLFNRLRKLLPPKNQTSQVLGFQRHWVLSDDVPSVIARKLALRDVEDDCEDYWEWAIGTEPITNSRIDIYRTHRVPDGTKTRVFFTLLEKGCPLEVLPEAVANIVVDRLASLGYRRVHFGTVYDETHHAFKADESLKE